MNPVSSLLVGSSLVSKSKCQTPDILQKYEASVSWHEIFTGSSGSSSEYPSSISLPCATTDTNLFSTLHPLGNTDTAASTTYKQHTPRLALAPTLIALISLPMPMLAPLLPNHMSNPKPKPNAAIFFTHPNTAFFVDRNDLPRPFFECG